METNDTLPTNFQQKLNRLRRANKIDDLMLSILQTMSIEAQVRFINSFVEPVGRPMNQKQLASGKILATKEELHVYRAGLIADIELYKEKLKLGERLKRPHGAGTIFLRQDKDRPSPYWVAFADLGPDPETGKRRRKKLRGKTRKEVEQKIAPYLTSDPAAELKRGLSAQSVQRLEQYKSNLSRLCDSLLPSGTRPVKISEKRTESKK